MTTPGEPALLDDDAPDPGRYVARNADGTAIEPQPPRVWDGPTRWRRRFGPATVHYMMGIATSVDDARALDGRRIPLDFRLSTGTWRTPGASGGFTHGHADLRDDDVVFIPLVTAPQVWLDDRFSELAARFRGDPAFMDDVADDAVAQALYAVLENGTLTPLAGGAPVEFGQRSAGRLVAALRANGEDDNDYFPGTLHDRSLTDRVRAHLTRLGWTT